MLKEIVAISPGKRKQKRVVKGERSDQKPTLESHKRGIRNASEVWVALLWKIRKVRGKRVLVVDEPGAVWFFVAT